MSIDCVYRNLVSATKILSAEPRATTLDGLPFFVATISLGRKLDDRMERNFNVWQFILGQVVEIRVSGVGIRSTGHPTADGPTYRHRNIA
jgi:hypothetical protein